ncbi:hypothetical protein P43SY_008556 [Pythium insidiosum]|uniref:ABC transporter domain-containing protein n=1 Tax=Pythium insidiosum TaxID=114742 RepID=A0AAD5Q9N5_PYTIN|nr:hypothetical protein P43SY_008556 [Pythium insidiosum]
MARHGPSGASSSSSLTTPLLQRYADIMETKAAATVLPITNTRRNGRHLEGTRSVLGALLHKNWIVKKRHPLATVSELLNPLICILLFAALKTLEPDVDIPSGWSTEAANATAKGMGSTWNLYAKNDLFSDFNTSLQSAGLNVRNVSSTPTLNASAVASSSVALLSLTSGLKIPRFYFTETTMPGLMLNLALQALAEGDRIDELSETDLVSCFLQFALFGQTSLDPASPYRVPSACKGKVVPYKIAITPDTTYTRKYFAATMDAWYPRIPLVQPVLGISPLVMPAFEDSRLFFSNETELERYIASEDYGLNLEHPKVYAAIAFQEYPQRAQDIGDPRGHSMAFSLRFNSTFTDANFPNSVPRTIGRRFQLDKFLRAVKPRPTMTYATRGFMTLQTAVMRVLNCMPAWDAATETVDATKCQLAKSTMKPGVSSDARLLRQLEDDMIIGSILEALSTLREFISSTDSAPTSLRVFMDAIKSLAITVDGIPPNSKAALLRVMRQAPQGFHGAAIYMSPVEGFRYAGFYAKVLVKETRSRELMRILGVHERQILFTWFLTYLQLFLVASILQTIGAARLLFPNSNVPLLFAFFFSFALSSFGYGFLVSTLFNRARAGSFVGMGVFFMMFFVSFSFQESTSEHAKTASCLLSPVALAQGINIIAQVESIGIGLNTQNAYESIDGFRFISAIWMQLFDFVLYILIGWYLEKVTPKEYGVPEKWYFPVAPSYWRRVLRRRRPAIQELANAVAPGDSDDNEASGLMEGQRRDDMSGKGRAIEDVALELKQQERDSRAILIHRLRKEFDVPGGTKVAVKELSLALYEGQITCLLGHNGAGKTTLMSMLTGMTPPTSGDAVVRGYSIREDMSRIRESMGYCPQFSVVYPELTVEEHLVFYGRVKGLRDSTALRDEVRKKIEEVGLTEKRHVQAHALSGGMKRKLSLAISFLGDSRVVFLDEPTSGMDPYSRRSTWELIQSNKQGRVLILTTHFMDEADILGDRIAIMAEGEIRCVGSSLFLKNRFGVGYRLSFVLRQDQKSGNALGSRRDIETRFVALLRRHVSQARLATDIGTELTFQLPFETSAQFPALFEELDARRDELGVESYAISVTTLEEIFLKVAESRLQPTDHPSTKLTPRDVEPKHPDQDGTVASSTPTHSLLGWFALQMRALLLKRLLCAKRDKSMLFYSTVLPIIVLFAGLSALKLSLFILNDPKVDLRPDGQFALGKETPIPFACVVAGGGVADDWCSTLMHRDMLSGGVPSSLPVEAVVYGGSSTPSVFNLPYTDPPISPNDTTGYCLRFGELAFERGYGRDASTMAPLRDPPVDGQYGGFVVQATGADQVLSYNIMVNSSSIHGAPTYKALVDEAIHRFLVSSNGAVDQQPRIRVATHPFPLSFKTRSIFGSFLSLPAVLFVLIAFTFIPASMMPFLVKEKQRDHNARHQQVLSGVSLFAYWLANFIFDLLVYLVPMVVAILLLRSYGITSSLSSRGNESKTCLGCTQHVPEAVIALFVLFGTAIAPWTYLMSHLMHDAGACLLYTVMLNFLFGLVLLLTSYSLDSLESTRAMNEVLVFLWRCSPLFSLSNGLLRVIITDIQALFGFSSEPRSAFSTEVAGNEIWYLAVEGPLFFVLAWIVDMLRTGELTICGHDVRHLLEQLRQRWRALMKPQGRLHAEEASTQGGRDAAELIDEDVKAERDRVLAQDAAYQDGARKEDIVRLLRLGKMYPNGKRALSQLTFGLQRGECFGFLGINGAGKTTTMKILTGDLFPTEGTAQLNGHDILQQRALVRQSIGYCPQFDALLELMTVREHLEFYGRLKGFEGAALRRQVRRLLTQFQLDVFETKLAGSLSGGNKRKLSVAIAMVGDPALLFLDEPSTGMDPFSRRFMWDIILEVSVQSRQSTIMLTTHSMEECEALCNRAGIMVGGRLRCFGSIPHLKARFGDGFLLECKLETADDDAIDALLHELCAVRGVALDASRCLREQQLPAACEALGAPARSAWVLRPLQHPTGAALHEQLQRRGGVLDARAFGAWWILEDRMARLTAFLETHFGRDAVSMLERQLDFARFKVLPPGDAPTLSLARTFRLVEDARRELRVKEYSISQTSLEQIFNAFARQQDEERGVAKAFWSSSTGISTPSSP